METQETRPALHHAGVSSLITRDGLHFRPHCSCGWEEDAMSERAARTHATDHADQANVEAGFARRCPRCQTISYSHHDETDCSCGADRLARTA